MERDGHDVSGAAAELVALVNYVTSSQLSMRELQTHPFLRHAVAAATQIVIEIKIMMVLLPKW